MKLSDFATLAEAQQYTQSTLKPLESRMVNERGVFALIGMTAGETLMMAIEAADIPARVKSWFKPSEKGVDIADPTVLGLLAGMVAAKALTQADSDKLTAFAYETLTPFANTTEHEWQIAKDTCPTVPVTVQGAYAVITTTAYCPKHNPRLLAVNPRTGKTQRISSFYGVEAMGTYDALIPPEWRGESLSVDNAYGVI